MFRIYKNHTCSISLLKFLILFLCALSFLVSTSFAAERGERRSRRYRDSQGRNKKGEDPEQQAKDAAEGIDTRLLETLEIVNEGKTLGTKQVEANTKILRTSRKHLKGFEDQMTCQYFMLQAWTDYFSGNAEKALKAAVKAYKTDRENNDAHLTQAGLAIVNGKKPIKLPPVKEKKAAKQTAQRRQGRRSNQTGPGQMGPGFMGPGMMGPGQMGPSRGTSSRSNKRSDSVGSGDILEFDLDKINNDMVNKTIEPLQLNCLNSTSFSYEPDSDLLCAMFWQIKGASGTGDPNESTKKRQRQQQQRQQQRQPTPPPGFMGPGMMGPGMMGPGMMGPAPTGTRTSRNSRSGRGSQQIDTRDPLTAEMDAFSELFSSRFSNRSVKFLAVNLDKTENRSVVVDKLLKNPWVWANVMANDPESNGDKILPSRFAGVEIKTDTMIIAAKSGTVKYAGPARGFIPPLVLHSIDGEGAASDKLKTSSSIKEKTKKTKPVKQNGPEPATKKRASEELEDVNPQAEKLLEHAKKFMKIGTRFTTPKQGIEMCRRILKEYPDTRYADEARGLLRSLPERHQKKYKITDEEMGL